MKKQFLEAGEIVSVHALSGEVRVNPWCDSPAFLAALKRLYLDQGEKELKITNARVHKSVVIMKIQGVNTVEEAQRLRSKVLYMNRGDIKLPSGRYFVQDLIGCEVFNAGDGGHYGEITAVSNTGASDVYHISKNGKTFMIPAVPEFIALTDIEAGRIEIRPIPGMFGEDE
ncbi:MAG: ribosome maturation factor RimM [Oscillospiraceae bacterium]|nr:ribosome maturation factor RimM [Oscillospiraceae bacterium]